MIDGPPSCPAIDSTRGDEAIEDHPEYAQAARSGAWQAPVLEAIEGDAVGGTLQIRVDEVTSIDVSRTFECGGEDTVDLMGANVLAELAAPDGSFTIVVPAFVEDADTDAPQVSFRAWSSSDPEVLAQVPDTDLADDAEIGLVEIETTDGDVSLYRTDMTLCTMVEGCSNTERRLLLRWSQDDVAAR